MALNFKIMQIQLNGNPHTIVTVMTVSELLASIGFGEMPVVVELNQQAVFPRDFDQTQVSDGARVEIVTLAAGG